MTEQIKRLSNTDKPNSEIGKIAFEYLPNGINIQLYDNERMRASIFFKDEEHYQRENVRWGWK